MSLFDTVWQILELDLCAANRKGLVALKHDWHKLA